ncbi:MAG: LPS export ABC transporter periplasmic protein LptC [Prevotella sp.]|nr:LPS export ABC transporter periplasmic protein LptC [Prevotella sp.]
MNRKSVFIFLFSIIALLACTEEHEHTAPAIRDKDSVPSMVSYGVNTLISDSGVIKYRIVTERWEMNDKRNPSRWIFDKGVFLTQFDQTLHIQSYIQCDTAYYFDKNRIWELRGRVRILTKQGLRFSSEELYWDEQKHEIWSHKFSHLKTPERELQGNYFKSNENMTKYIVTNTKGSFEKADIGLDKPNPRDSMVNARKADSTKVNKPAEKEKK